MTVGNVVVLPSTSIPKVTLDIVNGNLKPNLVFSIPAPQQGIQEIQGNIGNTGIQGIQGNIGNTGVSGTTILPTSNTWTATNTFNSSIYCGGSLIFTGANSGNFKLGYQSLNSLSSNGVQNTSIGAVSMQNTVNGSSNTSVGHNSLVTNINGSNNCSFGQGTLLSCLESGNSAFGQFAISSLSNGSNNSGIGYASGKLLYSGSNNTFLGSTADLISNGSSNNSTAIGYGAKLTGSNQIMIGTIAETVYIPGKLFVNNVAITNSTGPTGSIG